MVDATKKDKVEFRNIHVTQLASYRLPWAGKVSIFHRISGILLFLMLPLLLILFDASLTKSAPDIVFPDLFFQASPFVKMIVVAVVWAYLHHFCAGIRYLLLDIHIGIERASAQRSAIAVLVISVFLTALFAAKLFGFL